MIGGAVGGRDAAPAPPAQDAPPVYFDELALGVLNVPVEPAAQEVPSSDDEDEEDLPDGRLERDRSSSWGIDSDGDVWYREDLRSRSPTPPDELVPAPLRVESIISDYIAWFGDVMRVDGLDPTMSLVYQELSSIPRVMSQLDRVMQAYKNRRGRTLPPGEEGFSVTLRRVMYPQP